MLEQLNDLQLVDKFVEECRDFISPVLFRQIRERGLYNVINYLPKDINEAKAVARARLAKIGKSFGDAENDQIANSVQRIEALRTQLQGMSMTDADKIIPILRAMLIQAEFVQDYFKPVRIPR